MGKTNKKIVVDKPSKDAESNAQRRRRRDQQMLKAPLLIEDFFDLYGQDEILSEFDEETFEPIKRKGNR
jgi:hypothetical protein